MSNELKIGLTVLVAAVLLFFGVRFLQGLPLLSSGSEIVVLFEDAQGLGAGSAVRLNGVDVGSVRAVRLSDDTRDVIVDLAVRDGIAIPRASRFTTGGFSALGDVFVSIEPPRGASAGRPLADGDTVRAGSTGDLFSMLTDQAGPIAARTDTLLASATTTFREVEGLVGDTGDDLRGLVAQLRLLTTASNRLLVAEQARIGNVLASLQRAALSAERAAGQAEGLVADVSADAPGLSDSLAVSVARLNATLAQVETSLSGFDALSAQLSTTLTRMNTPDNTLGLMLTDPSLYYNANAAAASLEQLLTDFQNDPGRYLEDLKLVDVF